MQITMSNKNIGAPMKSPIVFFILLCTMLTCAFGQPAHESVAVAFKGMTIAFHSDPGSADAKLLPLIDAKSGGATKERFGFCLGASSASSKAVEIVDKDGAVLRSISIAELVTGKGAGIALLPQPAISSDQRWMEKTYALDLAKGKVQLILKALASGEANDQHLVVTFALKSDVAMTLGMHAFLPVSGNVDKKHNGFVLSAKNGSAAIAGAVYPASANVSVTKSGATLTSRAVALAPSRECAVLWLVLDGVSASTGGNAKEQAARMLLEKQFGPSDPHIVVVSTTDKSTTQPGDVVTYSLMCRNIGTGDATDVTLGNPVAEGLQYLEGSATSEGSTVTLDSKGIGGAVQNINWKFTEPIKPGEERFVTFKVRVL